MNFAKLKPWLLLAVVFLAGVIFGVASTRAMVRKFVDQAINQPDLVRGKLERDVTRDLKLRPDQRVKVRETLERAQQEIAALRKEFQPRLAQIIQRAAADIRAVLDEAQRKKFDKLLREKFPKPAAEKKPAEPVK
jgi:uncharacterized membrane-anchored protein YhcB (DUF1043 family)